MFKDTKEELERLEAVLLDENADEAPTEILPTILDDNTLDALLSEDHGFGNAEDSDIYKNFSNGYRANEDEIDEEDEEDEEYETEPTRDPVVVGLTILALVLVAGILGVLLWALITFRGLL